MSLGMAREICGCINSHYPYCILVYEWPVGIRRRKLYTVCDGQYSVVVTFRPLNAAFTTDKFMPRNSPHRRTVISISTTRRSYIVENVKQSSVGMSYCDRLTHVHWQSTWSNTRAVGED